MSLKTELEEFVETDASELAEKLDVIVKTYKKDMSTLKLEHPELVDKFSNKILEGAKDPEVELENFLKSLAILITDDPYIFKNNVYHIIAEIMMREKSSSSIESFERFLNDTIKIFSKDVNQFVIKLLDAISLKLDQFSLPKKRKRKSQTAEVSAKKIKLNDGSDTSCATFISNIWPQSTVHLFEDIITRLNVTQILNLWKTLNEALLLSLENVNTTTSENELFKIDFIAIFLCQIFTCSRIHEHLIYKQSEIQSAIHDFNQVQHKFYEVIFNTEHNNRMMSAFLRISYEYENFLMLYFYHFDLELKNGLDATFLTDKSRLKSSEWKIIQQRIRNFGKVEEKKFSNLLCVQQIVKSKLFDNFLEVEKDFLTNILKDSEQMDLMMNQKDGRAIVISLLKDDQHFSLFLQYLLQHIAGNVDISLILSLLEADAIDKVVREVLKNNLDENTIKLLQLLPLSRISNENKKIGFKKLLEVTKCNESANEILYKLLKNDSYRNLLSDFSMEEIYKKLKNSDSSLIYETIFKQNLKRMNVEMLEQFEWIISHKNEELFQIFAKSIAEIIFRNVSIPQEKLKTFKNKIINRLMKMMSDQNDEIYFITFSKMCIQNMSSVEEEIKERHMELFIKFMKNSDVNQNHVELFKLILRESKKLNLNDEIKGKIIAKLLKHLQNIIGNNLKSVEGISKRVDNEKELIQLMSSEKASCRLKCSQIILEFVKDEKEILTPHLIYCFKIFQVLFEHSEKQNNRDLIKNYMSFLDKSIQQLESVNDVDLLCTIFDTHNEMIKTNKENVQSNEMDNIFMFLIDTNNRPSSLKIEDFCKFYEAVGQFLYLVGNLQHQYFRSRQPQYFKVYQKFLDDVYCYQKENEDEEITTKEILMLQRLALQLENIIKMLMKNHVKVFGFILPYIVSPIVNVYMKNPKLIMLGDKFKLSIRNICRQLLSVIDDRARKHIYAVIDEPTRDFYSEIFSEIKTKK